MATRGRVSAISNELEFSVRSRGSECAEGIIRNGASAGISLSPEVNPRNVVELNISKKIGLRELNSALDTDISKLIAVADRLDCSVYGGSAVLEPTDGILPRAYRTTLLSKKVGIGMMQIVSQQIVIGASSEDFGFRLYNNFSRINPVLLALSASSPRLYGESANTHNSRRMQHYEDMFEHLPKMMYRHEPKMERISEYRRNLQLVSDAVNGLLRKDMVDTDLDRMTNENTFFPFTTLAPHQVYNPTRIRPDHRDTFEGGNSVMSIELRVCDIPTTRFRMQAINTLVVGLAYYLQVNEAIDIPEGLNGGFEVLKKAGKHGINADIGGIRLSEVGASIAKCASEGLFYQGYEIEAKHIIDMVRYLSNKNDAMIISDMETGSDVAEQLICRLIRGE